MIVLPDRFWDQEIDEQYPKKRDLLALFAYIFSHYLRVL